MKQRAKPISPSERSRRVAEDVLRNLCFTSYTQADVLRVARRISKEFEKPLPERRIEDDAFNTGFNTCLDEMASAHGQSGDRK